MLSIFTSGGPLIWVILVASIVALTIIIERFWTLRSLKISPRDLLPKVWAMVKAHKHDNKAIKALKQDSQLGYVLAAGLANAKHGREVMKDSMDEATSHVQHNLEKYLSTLGTIAAIAPLLGLLGTVLGMIEVFSVIVQQGTGDASALAGGISQALVTTAAGLSVAIPALVFHRALARRVDEILLLIDQDSTKLLDAMFSDKQVNGQDAQS